MTAPFVSLENASLAFGHQALLGRVNFQLEVNERVGLIGRNGCGKSSLLKLISGELVLDDGTFWRAPELRFSCVPQEPTLNPELSVFMQVTQGLGKLHDKIFEYHQVAQTLEHGGENVGALLGRLHDLQVELEHEDGWSANARIEAVIARMNLPADTKIGELSGGVKKRVALAQALVAEPALLILDEPTNHLDLPTIEWLEGLLQKFSGSVLFVTHDRRFLDNVATRIVELDRGAVTSYLGNYSAYEKKKAEASVTEAIHQRKFDKFLDQEEIWIRKGIEARRTRNEGRVLRLEGLRRERAQRRDRLGSVNFNLDLGLKSGKMVAELEHITKSFNDNVVIKDFSTVILRGDKVGLIGPNGIGKSTLLKLILGELEPDHGSVRLGSKISIAYYDQFREELDSGATVSDTIVQGSQFVEIGGKRRHVISYLEDFLFPAERARVKVSALSGGERNRLLLARLFARPANILVLDEPTNDLDIDTLELLETLLLEYSGTVLIVSHDREFLDNIVTQVIVFEGDGNLIEYAGGYRDWSGAVKSTKPKKSQEQARSIKQTKSTRLPKLTFREAQELEAVAHTISSFEQECERIRQQLLAPELYRSRPGEVKQLQSQLAESEAQLRQKMMRWEVLERKKEAVKMGRSDPSSS